MSITPARLSPHKLVDVDLPDLFERIFININVRRSRVFVAVAAVDVWLPQNRVKRALSATKSRRNAGFGRVTSRKARVLSKFHTEK